MLRTRILLIYFCFCFLTRVKSKGHFEAQTSHPSSYKVVIPYVVNERWRRETKLGVESEEEPNSERLTYSLSIDNKDHFLRLKKNKDFLAKAFVQYSYDANGSLVTSYPKVPEHCHYHGHVEGQEESLVALNTCSGLKGVILIGNRSYGIEPAVNSTTNEHVLFPLSSQPEHFACGVTDEMSHSTGQTFHDPTLTISRLFRKKRNLPLPRYVELVLVVDKLRFDFKKGNVTAVREEMVDLANLLDRYYKQLNIHVILTGLEIFQSGNPFNVDSSPSDVLGQFVKWRKKELIPRLRHDVGQLVVGRSSAYGGVLGMAFVGTVCSVTSAGGINVFPGDDLQYFSTIVAHEMGHNLGMSHDTNRCNCDGKSCIMAASAGGSANFSTCSGEDFEALIFRGGGICLKNQPSSTDIVNVADCGNGMLEEGEQCDCGQPEECNDKCCEAATCKFTPGSVCSEGGCCRDCQVRVSGTPCRRSVNVCDLPEFCNGKSAFCPEDFYIMDGHPCTENTAYCFEGRCQTYDYQCQHIFGKEARKAADICFKVINAKGNQIGNCGSQGTKYIPCDMKDAMCGKVQCTNVSTKYLPEGAMVTLLEIGDDRCVNADFDFGSDVLDPGYVKTGSGCGKGKACLDFKCINASALTEDSNCDARQTCHSNGVCNDQGHCHCDDSWAPPFCNKAGIGGSIDSGPTKIDHSLRDGLLIFFLLVVPILLLIAILLLYIFRKDWINKKFRNIRSRRNRSENTASNQANGNGRTRATPQPQSLNAPTSEPPPAYPDVISGPPSYEEINHGNRQYATSGIQNSRPQQGPGVPKPIPPKQPSDL